MSPFMAALWIVTVAIGQGIILVGCAVCWLDHFSEPPTPAITGERGGYWAAELTPHGEKRRYRWVWL